MDYVAHIAIVIMIYFILALALNLLMGYTGLFSFAHGAFFGIGA
ncbi:MAG: branched-chain amino acid ABC transporter permease, partial [Dehalococcoidia bacterium]